MCAELIKIEALVCRYCGHKFDESEVMKIKEYLEATLNPMGFAQKLREEISDPMKLAERLREVVAKINWDSRTSRELRS